jgi:hypothetical protein
MSRRSAPQGRQELARAVRLGKVSQYSSKPDRGDRTYTNAIKTQDRLAADDHDLRIIGND